MSQPEEDLAPADDRERLDAEQRDPEAPPEDAAEQAAAVEPAPERPEVRRGFEVGEWDAMEQSIVIDLDDEYDH